MQTNPAIEQNKNIRWSESPWNQSGTEKKRSMITTSEFRATTRQQLIGIFYVSNVFTLRFYLCVSDCVEDADASIILLLTSLIKTTFFGLHFCRRQNWSVFNQFT